MLSKRKREDSEELSKDGQFMQHELRLKENILSVCYASTTNPPARPSFLELKSRLRRAYHAEEATELISFVEARESDAAAFWSELEAVPADRSATPPLDADVSMHIRLLARLETERHMATRTLLQEKKRSLKRNGSQAWARGFDATGSAEKALELIEALPGGSRGTQAAHDGFFKLGREVAGKSAPPRRQVEFGKSIDSGMVEVDVARRLCV